MTLANKYRPSKFSDVVDQEVVCKVLIKQIESSSFSHAILFAGNAGCGKTTCAKLFANAIDGEILELDCASHNGVAEIKEIVNNSKVSALVHKYKVFVLDECHTLTSQAWASLLITLEENIAHSIFIFCTTDTQKIPNTIISRVQRFNFLPINDSAMADRLKYVCEQENITIEEEAINVIVKSAKGNLRQALTNLDKCLLYGDLSVDAVCTVLNNVSDELLSKLYDVCNKEDKNAIINTINEIYNSGIELHMFIRQFLDYCITLPNIKLVDCILTILQDIRYDDSPKNIIIARLITMNLTY